MKPEFPHRAGFGFSLALAVLTLVVAVLSAVYLLHETGPGLQAGLPPDFPAVPSSVQVHGAKPPHTDRLRAKPRRIAKNRRLHSGKAA